jgi:hypothetical protein
MLLRKKYVHMSVCILALLFCVLATGPFVSMGSIDDWSYIWTARVLADTGHLTYNGWATAMLGVAGLPWCLIHKTVWLLLHNRPILRACCVATLCCIDATRLCSLGNQR